MRKILCFLFITVLVVSLNACGYKEGIVQPSSNSYLKFTGDTDNAVATIDDGEPFPVRSVNENGKVIHYQISPGKHKIVITRNGNVVLNRELLIGDGMTKELNVK